MFALLFATLALALPPLQKNGKGPKPGKGQVNVTTVDYAGTGCSQGSVSVAIADDLGSFTLIFSDYQVSSGKKKSARKDCKVVIRLAHPDGFAYSLDAAQLRGYVNVPANVKATISSKNTKKSNDDGLGDYMQVFTGPYNDDYLVSIDVTTKTNPVWQGCKGKDDIVMKTFLELSGDLTQDAMMTVDSQDGRIKYSQIFGLNWKQC
ncbi:hypothetical protein HDV03_004901 [Kappamyces sp. JEL0829]|nr:hypothetical protein HDV03_004901 [Kappamyces sp. JEL0829]